MKKFKNKLLKIYKNLNIRKKILLLIYVQIIIPLFILGYMSYRNTARIIHNNAIRYSQDMLYMMEQRMNDYIRALTVISMDLNYDRTVASVLNNTANDINPIGNYENELVMKGILNKIIYAREEIQSICFVTNNRTYFDGDDAGTNVRIKEVLPYEKLLKAARAKKGKPVWYMDENRRIFMARTVSNKDTFEEVALMAMLLDKNYLDKLTGSIDKNMWNIAILNDKMQKVSERIISLDVVFNSEYVQSVLKNTRGYRLNEEKDLFISYISIREPQWLAVAYVPLDILYRDANTIKERIIILSGISVILLSILGIYIALDFVNPINRLVNAMKSMHEGDTWVKLEIERGDELGFLNHEFNKMSEKIHYLVNSVYKQQLANKEAQLKALQAQVNPHFLFNTLESINWTAQMNNVPQISDMVSALSSILEAGIARNSKPISLKRELEYVDKYIFILKQRFEEQLEYRKTIDSQVLQVRVPKLIIQPLIENAVYHGVEKTSKKGIITLKAKRHDNNVIISVIDNGRGIQENELGKLNQFLKEAVNSDEFFRGESEDGRSVGIENVNRRIRLFYGNQYGLRIYSKYNCYTKVIVTIPYEGKNGR